MITLEKATTGYDVAEKVRSLKRPFCFAIYRESYCINIADLVVTLTIYFIELLIYYVIQIFK